MDFSRLPFADTNWINATDFANLAAADAYAAANGKSLLVDSNFTISTATTLSSNIFCEGGTFTKSGSGTLSITGSFRSPLETVFLGFASSGVTFSNIEKIFPQWFGAKGDGTTDDADAIQGALHSIKNSGGGRLHFPMGTYSVGTASYGSGNALALDFTAAPNTKPVSITGDGAIIKHNNSETNITLNCAGSVANGYLDGLNISGITFIGTRTPSDTDIESGTNNNLIYLTYVRNGKISKNIFKNNTGSGIYFLADELVVSENTFINSNGGVQGQGSTQVSIVNNVFTCDYKCDDQIAVFGTSDGILIANNNIDKGTISGRNWGNGIGIGDDVTNAKIEYNIIINTNSSDSTDLAASSTTGLGGIYIDCPTRASNHITINGNTITYARYGIRSTDSLDYLTVKDNLIENVDRWGILISSTQNGATRNTGVTIDGNSLYNIGNSTDTDFLWGIYVLGTDNVSILNNNINTFDLQFPIRVGMSGSTSEATNITIHGNNITAGSVPTLAASAYGIYVNRYADARVSSNVVNMRCVGSIYLAEGTGTYLHVSDNVLVDYTSNYIVIDGATPTTFDPFLVQYGNYSIAH